MMRASFAGAIALLLLASPSPLKGQGMVLDPAQGLFSRYAADEIPANADPGDPDQLAVDLGLESTDQTGPDGERYFRHRQTGMLFVFVPGGTFRMGSDYSDIYQREQVVRSQGAAGVGESYFSEEQPQAEIYVSPFFIGLYEVTVAQYRQFLDAIADGGAAEYEYEAFITEVDHTPYQWESEEFAGFWGPDQPVVGVSWVSAFAFTQWMNARLPSEAEWEKAARGTDGRIWPWGNRYDPMRCNTHESMNKGTVAVGTYAGGRSPYGCYEMAGNVVEYTLDAFAENAYRYRKAKDHCLLEMKQREPSQFRTLRGGSWNFKNYAVQARTTARGRIPVEVKYSTGVDLGQYLHIGFRVVLSPLGDLYPPEWHEDVRRITQKLHERRALHAECEQLIRDYAARVNASEPPLTVEQMQTFRRLRVALQEAGSSPDVEDLVKARQELIDFMDGLD